VRYASVAAINPVRLIGGEGMKLEVGNRVKVESESTERSPRTGVIEEVIRAARSPRYRIRWDDRHESIYTPAAGAVSRAEPTETALESDRRRKATVARRAPLVRSQRYSHPRRDGG
jgi:hypothetical protein